MRHFVIFLFRHNVPALSHYNVNAMLVLPVRYVFKNIIDTEDIGFLANQERLAVLADNRVWLAYIVYRCVADYGHSCLPLKVLDKCVRHKY